MKKDFKLPDMQKSKNGFHKIPINKVGVRNIKVPFTLKVKGENKKFNTIAKISSYCNLVDNVKGINMSRISRTINDVITEGNGYGFQSLDKFAKKLQNAHNTDNIYIKAEFDYIYNTKTPKTGILSEEPVNVIFETTLLGDELHNYMTVKSTEMSLCPCSKEMSLLLNNLTQNEYDELTNAGLSDNLHYKIVNAGFGAHNQKSDIEIKVETSDNRNGIMWIEDLINIIRYTGASAPTWSTLKRPDEKYVTEVSYMGAYIGKDKKMIPSYTGNNGPKFVEDIARDIANVLNEEIDKRILDYLIVVNNQESIHSDEIKATAILTAGRILK